MAAGMILVREAGGFVSDCDGGDAILTKGQVVAGNDTMHRELLRLLKAAGKEPAQGDQSDGRQRAPSRRARHHPAANAVHKSARCGRWSRTPNHAFSCHTRCAIIVAAIPRAEPDRWRATSIRKLSSPRIFLIRMLVFLILCGLIAFVLQRQILNAFLANPWLNGLIIGVLVIGIILSFHQVIRLFPEVAWVNGFRSADPELAATRAPKLLAPMAAMLGGERVERVAISAQTMRAFLDSLATRLDEARDISRYLTGLLVFLGLLGTFWGLIETVGSVGSIINGLKVGGDADTVFDALKEGLAAPLGGMGISFSSSLFGLAGSLVLGFLDLQTSQAQNRFYTNLEDWLATTVQDLGVGTTSGGAALPAGLARRHRAAAPIDRRRRRRQGDDGRHGQSRRSDPGPGPAHAHRAADDPRLGRRAGQAQQRPAPLHGTGGARAGRAIEQQPALEQIVRRPHGAFPQPPRQRHELLAGLRRRAVDADPVPSSFCSPCSWWRSSSCRRKSPARTPRWRGSMRRSRG